MTHPTIYETEEQKCCGENAYVCRCDKGPVPAEDIRAREVAVDRLFDLKKQALDWDNKTSLQKACSYARAVCYELWIRSLGGWICPEEKKAHLLTWAMHRDFQRRQAV